MLGQFVCHSLSLGFILLAYGSGSVLAVVADGSAPRPPLPPPEVSVVERVPVSLADARLVFVGPEGERQEVRVVLKRVLCDARVPRRDLPTWSGRTSLYQLRSTSPGNSFSWAVAGPYFPIAVGFRLFRHEPGHNYLAWVMATSVFVAEVNQSRSMSEALAECFSADGPFPTGGAVDYVRVVAPHLVPDAWHWGRDAFNADITILSVAKDEVGGWVVQIASPEGEKFTIIGDGENWELE